MSRYKYSKVNEFMVWRAASSVGWDCTASEIASEVGLSESGVLNILKRKGWKLKREDYREGVGRWDVCALMKSGVGGRHE